MNGTLKRIIKSIVPNPLLTLVGYRVFDGWANKSYSQEGEDMILRRYFDGRLTGFYVDVGAHHPKRFSNTYFFYVNGWRGINIDAMPGSMRLFKKLRRRDINVETAISAKETCLTYYMFDEPALNSFSSTVSRERQSGSYNAKVIDKREIKTFPLSEVLRKHVPPGQELDFLSVDVEGLDLDVLKSNNWIEFRPTLVLAEILNSSIHTLSTNSIVKFMESVDYTVFAKCFHTVIFEDAKLVKSGGRST